MKEKKEKKEKKSMVVKLRVIPLYWKVVASIIMLLGGGCLSAQLITSSSDVWMCVGIVLVVLILWLLINMWLPMKDGESEELEPDVEVVDNESGD